MSYRASIYIASIFIVTAVLCRQAFLQFSWTQSQWPTFLALTVLATIAQLLKADGPKHRLYYATMVFQFAGAILLPPFQIILLQVICHLIEWIKERLIDSPHLRNWYTQPFNICTHILCSLAARAVYVELQQIDSSLYGTTSVLAGLLSAFTYLVVNHLLIGLVIFMARGVTWSLLLDLGQALPDYINLCLGYVVAVVWHINAWLIIPVLSPLIVIYQALLIPKLKEEAQIDTKTELWNARHFNQLFAAELQRARRFRRPLALLMADLDLLRNINNTYGHLAGDEVLKGIGRIIRETIREYDIAGRFGGEEFAIALPEAAGEEAQAIADRLRRRIMNTEFHTPTGSETFRVTMSIGVACYPTDARTLTELVHAADVAVYQAKLNGRNRVVCAADLPHSATISTTATPIRSTPDYQAAPTQDRSETPAAVGAEAMLLSTSSSEGETRPDAPTVEQQPDSEPTQNVPRRFFWPMVSSVILAGASIAAIGFLVHRENNLALIMLFALLAIMAELLQIDLYDTGSLSVSVAIAFAAALIAGIPGVVCVSLAIALAHYIQRRPPLYKSAFNWGTHILAGTAPTFTLYLLDLPLETRHLPILALPLAAASIAYYLIETGLIATVIGLAEGSNPLQIWRQRYRWLGIHYVSLCIIGLFLAVAQTLLGILGMLVFSLPVLMMRYAQKQYVERTEGSIRELRRMNQELTRANREIVLATRSIRQLNDELFSVLAKMLDARDPYVSGHAARVAKYASILARELGLNENDVEQIRQAAFLHDIGKIGISEQILHKPSRLTTEEYEHVKTHAALGASFLETCQGLRHLAPLVRHHHERWDGHGYPDGLAAENIPFGARILALCDAVEVMASDRPYQRALTIEQIIAELKKCGGTQFDPHMSQVFLRLLEERSQQLLAIIEQGSLENQLAREGVPGYNIGWLIDIDSETSRV